jgi:hypothetical protein
LLSPDKCRDERLEPSALLFGGPSFFAHEVSRSGKRVQRGKDYNTQVTGAAFSHNSQFKRIFKFVKTGEMQLYIQYPLTATPEGSVFFSLPDHHLAMDSSHEIDTDPWQKTFKKQQQLLRKSEPHISNCHQLVHLR